jgi:hypothetical protein
MNRRLTQRHADKALRPCGKLAKAGQNSGQKQESALSFVLAGSWGFGIRTIPSAGVGI